MKAKINMKLYVEALKQLKVMGITMVIIYFLEAVLIAAYRWSADYSPSYYTSATVTDGFPTTMLLYNPLLVLIIFIVAPMMTLYLFNFINKRNACDFFHAIPVKRGNIYFCFILAIMTWIAAIIAISIGTSCIGAFIISDFNILDASTILTYAFDLFAGSFFVVAAITIAMSVTGRIFTNVMVSLILIFVPRIYIKTFIAMTLGNLPMVDANHFLSFLDEKYNVVSGTILNLFSFNGDLTYGLTSIPSGVYTLVLALIYAVIAWMLFRSRKSEIAGKPALSRGLQTLFRMAASMFMCMFGIMALSKVVFPLSPYAFSKRTYLILAVIAFVDGLITYFVYELASTRKIKSVAKSTSGLIILLGINIIVFFAAFGVCRITLSQKPDAEDITSVQIIGRDNQYFSFAEFPGEYFEENAKGVKIKNDEVNRIISEALKQNIDDFEKSPDRYYTNVLNGKYICIKINEDLFYHYRMIYLTDEEYNKIMSEISKDEEYSEAYLQMPDIEAVTGFKMWSYAYNISQEDLKTLYKVMQEEVKEMDVDEFNYLVNYTDILPEYNCVDNMQFQTVKGNTIYELSIPIVPEMPKTYEMYYALQNKDDSTFVETLKENILNDSYSKMNIQLTGSGLFEGTEYEYMESEHTNISLFKDILFSEVTEEEFESIMDLLEELDSKSNESNAIVTATVTYYVGGTNTPYGKVYNISFDNDEDKAKVIDLILKYY